MAQDVPGEFLPPISASLGIDKSEVRTSRDIRRTSVQNAMDRMSAEERRSREKPSVPVARPLSIARPVSVAGYRSANQRMTMTLSDEELARRLQEEYDGMPSELVAQEVQDNRYAQELLDEEIRTLERQQSQHGGEDGGDGGWGEAIAVAEGIAHLDYMRPRSYKPYFSCLVFVVCAVMMLVEFALNDWKVESFETNPTIGPSADVLLKLGAKKTDLIVNEGEWWRLFCPMALHAGILHLAFNMLGLLNIGTPAEREFGSLKIGAIFLVSGLNGVLLSAIFVPLQLGVGASGAIFGLFGAAWADLFQNWGLYRGQACRVFIQLFLATSINLVLGLVPFLDNFAHLGGFVAGFIFGLTLLVQNRFFYNGQKKNRKCHQLFLQALGVVLLPAMMITEILVLYLEVPANEWCTFCQSLSCVPMPPGKPESELWWSCHICEQGGLLFSYETLANGSGLATITCPSGAVFQPLFESSFDPLDFCKRRCPLALS